MIINSIGAKKFSLNDKKSIRLILKTSNGRFESGLSLYSNSLYNEYQLENDISFINNVLNDKIKSLEINSLEDLKKLESIIKSQEQKILRKTLYLIESAIIKAVSKDGFWSFLDKGTNMIPRPLGIIVGNSEIKRGPDFRQLLLFSLENNDFRKGIDANLRVHELLEREIKKYDKNFHGEINLQGALVPDINNFDLLDLLSRICRQVSDEFKFSIRIGINFDADSLYNKEKKLYHYNNYSSSEKEKSFKRKEQIEYMIGLVSRYNLFYIEDPLEKNDFKGYAELKKKLDCLVIGNKLIGSKSGSLNNTIKQKCVSAVILRLNDIGSLTEANEFIESCSKNNIRIIFETADYESGEDFIVQFCIAFKIPVIKYGIYKKDRDKLNEILKIEKTMKNK